MHRPSGAGLEFDRGTLLLRPSRASLPGHKLRRPWVWDGRVNAWRCDASLYRNVRRKLPTLVSSLGEDVEDRLALPRPASLGSAQLPTLRQDQKEALRGWRRRRAAGVIVMPTGTGKTIVGLAAMAMLSRATLVVAPVRTLMYQWRERIAAAFGQDSGVVADGQHEVRDITVTTYHSAAIHMESLGDRFGLVIFDEVHHLPAGFFREGALRCAAPYRLGLTATLERDDGGHAELDTLVGPVVYRQGFDEARGTTLADYDVVRVPVRLAEEERERYRSAAAQIRNYVARERALRPTLEWRHVVGASATDPEARAVVAASREKRRIEERAHGKLETLAELLRLHAGERVIVFTGSNWLALRVSERFLVPCILSHSSAWERREIVRGLRDGEFTCVVANQVLDEGFDLPAAKIGVVLGGMASARQARQRLGRLLRAHAGTRATLYEVVCDSTGEVERSRTRRRNDAFSTVRHRRVPRRTGGPGQAAPEA